jgi:hypothetical protein
MLEIPEQQYVSLPYEPNQQLEKEASNQERQPEHRNHSTNKTPDQKQYACCEEAIRDQISPIQPHGWSI